MRPCMYYQIGMCSGPCANRITKERYDEIVGDLTAFLEGKNKFLEQRLTERMEKEARAQNYEAAAKIRDQIFAIRDILVPQVVVGDAPADIDIFGVCRYRDNVRIAVLHITKGTLTDSNTFAVQNTEEDGFMTNCILQFYLHNNTIPRFIYTDILPEGGDILEQILSDLKGAKVSIRKGVRGKQKQWVEMARENACSYGKKTDISALDEIADAFHLEVVPLRMECYDISSFQGSHPVASRVVFVAGEADKDLYRRYRIRGIQGQDDFAMMEQVLTRRLKSDEIKPDLLVIDGGKGQLGVCIKVLEHLGFSSIPVVAMAKPKGVKTDRFFVPGRKDAIMLPPRSQALRLMQQIRDEAHRFAVKYHKNLRSRTISTVLEKIPGIGPKKARSILMHTAHISELSRLKPEDLKGCRNLTEKDVSQVLEFVAENIRPYQNDKK